MPSLVLIIIFNTDKAVVIICLFFKYLYCIDRQSNNCLNLIDERVLSCSSFMPIHSGAETDLRFVYCAGEEHDLMSLLSNLFVLDKTLICYVSFHLFHVGRLEWHGQGENKGVHSKMPGI